MQHDLIVPSPGDLAIAAALVIASGALLWAKGVELARPLLVSALRCGLQLLAVGYVLGAVFELDSAWAVGALLVLMGALATQTVASRVPGGGRGIPWHVAAALASGTALTLFFAVIVVLAVEPWYSPRYIIPLFGMLLGNSLNGATLAAERLDSEVSRRAEQIETLLCLGASAREAGAEAARAALKAALLPTVNAMAVAGVVALPGMMTGQILSGTAPTIAVRYQLLIWFMIATSVTVSAVLLVRLRMRRHFTAAHQLRRRFRG